MMPHKRVLIFALLFAILAGLAYWQFNIGHQSPKKDTRLVFPDFDFKQISRICLNKAGIKRELEREGTQWYLAANRRLPANGEMIGQALNALKHAQLGDLITEDEQKYGLFQLDSGGLEVRINLAGDKILSEFVVGKPGPDYMTTYFRWKNSKGVWLIRENLRLLDQPDWVERRVFVFKPEYITGINLEYPDEKTILILEKRDSQWYMTGTEESAVQAERVQSFLNDLLNLRLLDYADGQDYTEAGLDNPKIKVKLSLSTGQTLGLIIGGNKDSGITYAQTVEQSRIILLSSQRISVLQKNPEDFLGIGA